MLLGIGNFIGRGSGRVSGAAQMLGARTNGLAINAEDMSLVIRDTATPANNFSGDANSKLAYASPSTKWVWGKNGLLASGTALRPEYDASGNLFGFPAEGQLAGLIGNSNNPAAWSVPNLTVTPGDAIGPDGTLSMSRLTVTATGTVNINHSVAVTAGATYTHYLILKKGNGKLNRFAAYQGGDLVSAYVNFDTLAVTYSVGSSGVAVKSLPGGFIQVSVTWVAASTGTANVYFGAVGDTWTAGDYVHVWNAQCVPGTVSTSPIVAPTASTVTRAADVITLATNLFPSGFPLSIGVVGRIGATPAGVWSGMCGMTNGAAGVHLGWNPSAQGKAVVGATPGADLSANGTFTAGSRVRMAAAFAENDVAISLNGAAVTTDTAVSMPSGLTLLQLGASYQGAVNPVGVHLEKLIIVPGRLSNAELQGLLA